MAKPTPFQIVMTITEGIARFGFDSHSTSW